MSILEIECYIRLEYGLRKNVKIKDIDLDNKNFKIRVGKDFMFIRFPQSLNRAIKLEQIGI